MSVTGHRYDSFGGTAQTPAGRRYYPLPNSADPLPPDLLADAGGPILAFLMAADSLSEFILWAQEVFAGQEHPGANMPDTEADQLLRPQGYFVISAPRTQR